MQGVNKIVLSVAGFDRSAGAGVLADIKTFERFKVYGLGVSTATTFQTDKIFQDCVWVKVEDVLRQLNLLFDRFEVACVKIGIVPNIYFLSTVVSEIKSLSPDTKIVWDPVYKSSTGFSFFSPVTDDFIFTEVLKNLTLLTPNVSEALFFGKEERVQESAKRLSAFCSVLLKDGHGEGETSTDILYLKEGNEISLSSPRLKGAAKHGSGCVLSAAITSLLAQGESLEQSCKEAKEYMSKFLISSNELLGYHVA
ncbi:MAG: hydroxymethylpyrimidine/phosphomethylpyrimidine kinase [Bacteroidetes bacterium]|nr:hydroxymethylpyrimidine/phosphomethylpyrimidine kinase [Bacteroidota bacterium]